MNDDVELAMAMMRACLDGLAEAAQDDPDEAADNLLEHAQALADEIRAAAQ